MADTLTIGSVVLTSVAADLLWSDEYAAGSDLVGQSERVTITGALVVQASAQQAGRRMTLVGGNEGDRYWGMLSRGQVDALRALAAVPGASYAIELLDGRTFTAMFRRDSAAVEAQPMTVRAPFESGDYYIPTIRLVLI